MCYMKTVYQIHKLITYSLCAGKIGCCEETLPVVSDTIAS